MTEVPPSFGIAFRIFVAILWRSLVIGMPIMFIVGAVTAMMFSAGGKGDANLAANIAVFIVGIFVNISSIQLVLGKSFGQTRLVLVSADAPPAA